MVVHIVTHDEYERSKARLEEQRRAGIELVETAYHAQVRALDLVWMLQGEEADAGRGMVSAAGGSAVSAPAKKKPSPPVERPRRRRAPEVDDDVREAFSRLPERFTRREVCEALGYEPDRGALYRTLGGLTQEGHLRVESIGGGRKGTVYRKTGGGDSPSQT